MCVYSNVSFRVLIYQFINQFLINSIHIFNQHVFFDEKSALDNPLTRAKFRPDPPPGSIVNFQYFKGILAMPFYLLHRNTHFSNQINVEIFLRIIGTLKNYLSKPSHSLILASQRNLLCHFTRGNLSPQNLHFRVKIELV